MRILFLILLVISYLLIGPKEILACSCAPSRAPADNLQLYTNVFSGRVTDIVESSEPGKGGNILVTFNVVNVWKGERAEQLTLSTHNDTIACGFPFKKDEEYFVYAHRPEDGVLQTSTCSQTKKLSQAQLDLKELGPGNNIQEIPSAPIRLYRQNYLIFGIIIVLAAIALLFSKRARQRKR